MERFEAIKNHASEWKISQAQHHLQKICAERRAAGAAFAAWFARAQLIVKREPARHEIIFQFRDGGKTKCFSAEDCFYHSGFFEIRLKKIRQIARREHFARSERFEAERVRQRADGESAISQVEQPEIRKFVGLWKCFAR